MREACVVDRILLETDRDLGCGLAGSGAFGADVVLNESGEVLDADVPGLRQDASRKDNNINILRDPSGIDNFAYINGQSA